MVKTINQNNSISSYHEWLRWDAIEAVPASAKCVLSVGCAAGKTEEVLVKRGIEVFGVELNPHAAGMARQRGVTVLEGDASEIDVSVNGQLYDCILYADILEHLPDPVSVLKRHIEFLKPGGIVYISVPNFRHYSVLWQLFVQGHIKYDYRGGILDFSHLRITTRKMVVDWFDQVGLQILDCRYAIWGRKYKLISACLLGIAREFMANQIALVARKSQEKLQS